jgi:hypothetical protein
LISNARCGLAFRSSCSSICAFQVRTPRANNTESGEGGPCLTDAAHEPLSMNRSHPAWPLRCDPNGHPSDHRGAIPRWCHAILRALSCAHVISCSHAGLVFARNLVFTRNNVFPRASLIIRPVYLTSAQPAKCQAMSRPFGRPIPRPRPR